MSGGWQGGVLASLLGSFSGTLGAQLRISSLTQENKRRAQVLQLLGWTFWLLGQTLGQVAILLAPATVAACVTFTGSLLSNALLAPLVLHEQLTAMHALSVILLATGGGVVTSSSSHTDQEYTWHQLRSFLSRPEFLTVASFFACAAAVLSLRAAHRQYLDLLSFAYLFALVGSIDLLVTKFTLQLLRLLVVGKKEDVSTPDGVVTISVGLMVALHVGTFCCQVAAAYYRKALQSLPLFLGSGALMQVLLCGIFFNEFGGFSRKRTVVFLGGFGLVLAGMVATSMAAKGTQEVEESPAKAAPGSLPVFTPPTARKAPVLEKAEGNIAIISSGLLERSSSSLSSADLFLLGDIQKSALCFGGRYALGKASESQIGLKRKFESERLLRPLLGSAAQPKDGGLGRVASAPPMAGPLAGLGSSFMVWRSDDLHRESEAMTR